MNPGKHGVYSFLSFDGYDWDVVNATDICERPIWQLLDRQGLTSVVVNVPVTHPAEPFDGALIPGYTAPEQPDCHPAGLLSDVTEATGEYRVYPPSDSDEALAEKYRSLVAMRGDAFRYLADRFDPEFGFLQFQATDSIFHHAPEDESAIRTIYQEVDRQVQQVIDSCDPDNIIIASDHGMGPYSGYEFRLNSFLGENGYIETENGGSGMPTWATVREGTLKEGDERRSQGRGLGQRAMTALGRLGLTSQRIGGLLARLGLDEHVAKHVPTALVKAGTAQVDFPQSTAYMRSRIELGVRINLEEREPDGVVSPDEYDRVRSELIEELRSVRTPDGDAVFESVEPREAHFEGPESEAAVDIVTVPADFDHFLSTTIRDEQFGPPAEPWNHKMMGTFAARGEDITACPLDDAHLFDVAPTVLSTLDIPFDERMDGTPLACTESAGRTEYPRYEQAASVATEDAQVEQQLADLGYL
jgi:predicted AlkP superfamily phosphohydrolase/phosphomutase